ncbi:MAG: murein hydrolase activator EnvC family protein [Methylophilaceae bacterium]
MQLPLRLSRQCFFCLAILPLLFGQSVSFADQKTDAAKKDISGIKKKINTIEKKLNQTKAKQDDVTDALKKSETAISATNKKLYEIKQAQKQNELKLSTLKKESQTINEQLEKQQKKLSALLYQQYIHGNQSYTRLILESKSPSQITRDLRYQSYIGQAHTKLIDNMQSNLDEIKVLDTKTTEALQKVVALKEQQEKEHEILEKEKSEKKVVLKKLSKEIAEQRGQIKKLKRDEKRLSDLVKKLARITKQKQQQQATKKETSTSIAKNQETPDNRYAGKKFVSLKGKLKLPVIGELMNRFGNKRKDGGLTWKGLFIRADEGASVKSVASGRVVFAEWMRGFGNLIIIDHGSGYMSLYGNNQTILKNVGEDVTAGDTIAQVGNTGGNQSHGVYYELRNKSIPFDPLKWSSLR